MTTTIDDVEDISPRVQYTAGVSQADFDFPFPIFENEDIVVDVDGVTLALDTDYSVTGAGNDTGGTVALTVPETGGQIVTIYRDIPIERSTDFQQNGPWTSAAINTELDRFTMISQQLEAAIQRCLRIPITANVLDSDIELPPAVWANKYVTFDSNGKPTPALLSATTMTSELIGQLINPTHSTETGLGITVVNHRFPVDPYVDPRRYGADPTGVADATTPVQSAISVAYALKGEVKLGAGVNYLVSNLALTFTGNHTNDGLRISGSSPNGSRLTQKSTSNGPVLSFTGAAPAATPQESPLELYSFSVFCRTGKVNDGIVLTALAEWNVNRVYVANANKAISLDASLLGEITGCELYDSNYGLYARNNAGCSGTNLVSVRRNRFFGNSEWGIDWGSGDQGSFDKNDMEVNGTTTAITFTGALSGTATSGTLTANWARPTGVYPVYFSDAEVRAVTLTNGAKTATWTTGLTGGVTANANATTGSIVIRSSVSTATGLSTISMTGNWNEGNFGQSVFVENTSGLTISFKGMTFYADTGGHSLFIAGADMISIEDSMSPSAGQSWELNGTVSYLKNCRPTILNDNTLRPTYVNVETSTVNMLNGRKSTFTGTLTGCTTSPTASITMYEQGDEIALEFLSALTAVSNTNACTITGLPAAYWPKVDTIGILMVQDNGVNQALQCQVSASTGVITVGNSHMFTTSGGKGVVGGELRFRRP